MNALIGDQLKALKEEFEITVITHLEKDQQLIPGVRYVHCSFERNVHIYKDLRSLFQLIFILGKAPRKTIINYSTPKAALLGSISSYLFRGKFHKVYTMRGRVYENYIGFKRWFYLTVDKLICALSDKVIFLSYTALKEFVGSSLITPEQGVVIFNGSGAGVNLNRFKIIDTRDYEFFEHKRPLKILFAGRVHYDKGIVDFFEICNLCQQRHKVDLEATIVGRLEMPEDHFKTLLKSARFPVKYEHWTEAIEENFFSNDILLQPSYREGFGNVYIQGSASGCMPFAYNITGVNAAISHGYNGFLSDFKTPDRLAELIVNYINNGDMTVVKSAADWTEKRFDSKVFNKRLSEFYKSL